MNQHELPHCSLEWRRKSLPWLHRQVEIDDQPVPGKYWESKDGNSERRSDIGPSIHPSQNFAGKIILSKVVNDVLHARVGTLKNSAKQWFDLVPSLLDCMNIALRRATLVTRSFESVNSYSVDDSIEPWYLEMCKLQTRFQSLTTI